MTMPQLAAVQAEVVALGGGVVAAGGAGGAAGAAGIDVDGMYDIDIPPPHALKVAVNKVHAAADNHRRRVEDSLVGRFARCMVVSPACVWLCP
jgi:hypothetical protein